MPNQIPSNGRDSSQHFHTKGGLDKSHDIDTNHSPGGERGIALGTDIGLARNAESDDCTTCGDTSHILIPLADLLKAVASSLQNQTGHVHTLSNSTAVDPQHSSATSEPQDLPSTLEPQSSPKQSKPPAQQRSDDQTALYKSPGLDQARTKLPLEAEQHDLEHERNDEPVGCLSHDIANHRVEDPNDRMPDPSPNQLTNDHIEDGEEKKELEEHEQEELKENELFSNAYPDQHHERSIDGKANSFTWKKRTVFPFHLIGKSKESDTTADAPEEESHNLPRFKNWQGLDGIAVMLFGVVFPALIFAGGCASVPKRLTLILLNHPVETAVQLALIALIPLTNYALWSALRKDDARFTIGRGIALGSAAITSLFVCGLSIACLSSSNGLALETEIGTSFAAGFTWLATMSLAAAAASLYIVRSFQKPYDFVASRRRIVAYTALGAALTSCTLVGSEAKNFYVRNAERMAVSTSKQESAQGLEILRPIYSERDLLMECSDSRAAGLSGLFFPIKSTPQQELYFRLTGRPFSFKDEHNDMTVMPDDYIARHAVGDKVPGLSLVRSEMSASVKPMTLAASVDWTFVFNNESNGMQQARTELNVPPGAVITSMTEWVNGQPVHAVFTGGKNQQDTSWNTASSAAVTDLGHGRALLRCSEVAPAAQIKMAVKMIVPLKPESLKSSNGEQTASLLLPKLIATNYTVDDDNKIQLYSPLKVTSDFSELKQRPANGVQRLVGTVEGKRLESAEIMVTVERPEAKPVAVLDKLAVKFAQEDQRRREQQRRSRRGINTPLPQQLTVIVDGRMGIQTQLDQLAENLNQHRDRHGLKPVVKIVKPEYIVQSVSTVKNKAPKHLLIVVDGSASMQKHLAELKRALSRKSIPVEQVEMMIASEDNRDLCKKMPLASGLQLLEEKNFKGGQNNLKTVIDAAEEAGSAQGGAVLWIHGPQPITSGQIYITTPYAAHPALYELPIENGEIDTAEFFKNHSDIGEFMQVSHKSKLDTDIACFFSKWQPDNIDFVIATNSTNKKPEGVQELKEAEATEILQLNAYRKAMKLLAEHKNGAAARVAVAYGVLTPVSSLVIDRSNSNQNDSNQTSNYIQSAAQSEAGSESETGSQTGDGFSQDGPQLQGATNGTIGPQGADATYVCGVNTAGTVRVNNLANLEALLNIIANASEIGSTLVGLGIALSGFSATGRSTMGRRLIMGASLLVVGLSTPGILNWLIASARDANLFS